VTLGTPRDTLHILRPRNILIFLSTFGLLVGHRMGNPGLWAMGLGAAALGLFAAATAPFLLRRVDARRIHDPRAFQGDDVQTEVRLRTEAHLGAFLVDVLEYFPPAGPDRIRSLYSGVWGRGREVVVRYRRTCHRHRGIYVLGPLRIHSSDPLGLFDREALIPLFTTLQVYPQAPELMQFSLLDEGTRPHTGIETVRMPGQSEEFIGLRDYRRGDPPRRIHWPTSAHHGRLLVKDFQDERTTEVSIVLDLGRLGLTGLGDQSTGEYAIMCAAAIARQAFEKAHAFQLFAVGNEIGHVPVGRGMQHLLTILDRLTFLRVEGNRLFAEELAALRPFFRRGSTVVLVFSATTLDLEHLAPLLENLLEERIKVIVALIDDRTFPKLYREQEQTHLAAAKIEEAVTHLRLLGARVHVLRRHPRPEGGVRDGLSGEAAADVDDPRALDRTRKTPSENKPGAFRAKAGGDLRK